MQFDLLLISPQVFVDNDDPSIVYSGPWEATQNLETDMHSLTMPGNTPWYGTLHSTAGNEGTNQYSFRFTFIGSFVITNFRGKVNQNDPTPCQLDGSSQLMQLAIAGDQFYCETIAAVTPGEHTYTFSISTSPGSISFDWLSYFPVEIPHDSDIFYVADSALSRGGDSWVVNFTGIAAAVYGGLQFIGTGESSVYSLSYVIDQGQAVNFTLNNPSENPQMAIDNQLLVQTPLLPFGQHTLIIKLLKTNLLSEAFVLSSNVIVQNSNLARNLEVVPAIPGSGTVAGSPVGGSLPIPATVHHSSSFEIGGGTKQTSIGGAEIAGASVTEVPGIASVSSIETVLTISGSATTIFATQSQATSLEVISQLNGSPTTFGTTFASIPTATETEPPVSPIAALQKSHHISKAVFSALLVPLLLIGLIVWRSIVRRWRHAGHDLSLATPPFSAPNPQQIGRFMLAQYTTAEKTDKYRQALGIPDSLQDAPSTASIEAAGIVATEEPERANQPRRLRYRYHEDGGEVVQEQGGEIDDDGETISLPPVYVNVAGPRPEPIPVDANPFDDNFAETVQYHPEPK